MRRKIFLLFFATILARDTHLYSADQDEGERQNPSPVKMARPVSVNTASADASGALDIRPLSRNRPEEFSGPSIAMLPPELISRIYHFLPLRDLSRLSRTCSRFHAIFLHDILEAEFVNPKTRYAQDFTSLFSGLNSPIKSIRLKRSVGVTDGDLEVHFCDWDHLEEIIQNVSKIDAQGNIYYVRDPEVQNGKEFQGRNVEPLFKFFVQIFCEGSFHLGPSDKLHLPLPCVTSCASGQSQETYDSGQKLLQSLKELNLSTLSACTKEGLSLMEEQGRLNVGQQEEATLPAGASIVFEGQAPSLKTIALLEPSEKGPLIYVGNSVDSAFAWHKTLPSFPGEAIFYVDPDLESGGLYSLLPLRIRTGFSVESEGDFVLLGTFQRPEEIFLLRANNIWLMGCQIDVEKLCIEAKGDVHMSGYPPQCKPEKMSHSLWARCFT
jgi:hypothetical protein